MNLLIRPEQIGALPSETAMRGNRGYIRVFPVEELLSGGYLTAVNDNFHRYFPDTRCSCCVADN